MRCPFILGEKNAVPGRPLHVLVPPDHDQVIEIIPGTEDGLRCPNVLGQVLDILELHAKVSLNSNFIFF